MPATFKAAVLNEFKTPIVVREFPLIESIDPGGALVRVQMAGVCGTDVHLWKGQLSIPRPNISVMKRLASLNSAGKHSNKTGAGSHCRRETGSLGALRWLAATVSTARRNVNRRAASTARPMASPTTAMSRLTAAGATQSLSTSAPVRPSSSLTTISPRSG